MVNNVSEASVTTCSGNPFHKDTTRLQKRFLATSSLEAFFKVGEYVLWLQHDNYN